VSHLPLRVDSTYRDHGKSNRTRHTHEMD